MNFHNRLELLSCFALDPGFNRTIKSKLPFTRFSASLLPVAAVGLGILLLLR